MTPEPDLPLAVLYADAHLVAVDKPAGVPSHPLHAGERGTLANALVARYPECAGAGDDRREAGLGHRLDNGTSGVILAARRHDVWLALRAALKAPSCEKSYLAEVIGRPSAARGSMREPIGRRGRRGSRVVVGGQGRNPLPAATEWEVINARPDSTLLRVRLHAGRAHQVRAHLAALGHPLVGDQLYGHAPERDVAQRLGATSVRLHAESVSLRHPMSGQAISIAAPPPSLGRDRRLDSARIALHEERDRPATHADRGTGAGRRARRRTGAGARRPPRLPRRAGARGSRRRPGPDRDGRPDGRLRRRRPALSVPGAGDCAARAGDRARSPGARDLPRLAAAGARGRRARLPGVAARGRLGTGALLRRRARAVAARPARRGDAAALARRHVRSAGGRGAPRGHADLPEPGVPHSQPPVRPAVPLRARRRDHRGLGARRRRLRAAARTVRAAASESSPTPSASCARPRVPAIACFATSSQLSPRPAERPAARLAQRPAASRVRRSSRRLQFPLPRE